MFQLGAGVAAGDGGARGVDALGDAVGAAGDVQRRTGVEADDVARQAGLVLQRLDQHDFRFLRIFDAQVAAGGHADAETALRRQQEEISFPVAFDWLRARIEFVKLAVDVPHRIGGVEVTLMEQYHSHKSYGYRFDAGGKSVIYSTDSEHRSDQMDTEARFEAFFAGADLVVCDTMYSLGDTVSLKQDWGHSSSLVAIDLCRMARAGTLALFHHEPTFSDAQLQTIHAEAIQYEALTRGDDAAVNVICAYDGLEFEV